MKIDINQLSSVLDEMKNWNSEKMMTEVESLMSDEAIEVICHYIEDFYGLEDDEEIGTLAQIMIQGLLISSKFDHNKGILN